MTIPPFEAHIMNIITTASLSVNIWPNGEYGIGRTRPTENFVESEPEQPTDPWVAQALRVHGYEAVVEHYSRYPGKLAGPLGLSSVANSHTTPQTRVRRGTHGITSYGQRFVRNAAFLMEGFGGRQLCSFLTVTLPSLNSVQFSEMEDGWSEFVRQYVQKLGRALRRAGLPRRVVYLVEIQESRWKQSGMPYPHLHLLFIGRKRGGTWAITPTEFDRILSSVAENVWGWARDVTWSSASNVQRVKRSCQGYLGKYMSKGSKTFRRAKEAGQRMPQITSWWGVGGKLKRYIKRRMAYLSAAAADTFNEYACTGGPGVLFHRSLFLEHAQVDGRQVGVPSTWIGAYGRVESDQVEWWRVLGQSQIQTG